MRLVLKVILIALAAIGALTVAVGGATIAIALAFGGREEPLPDSAILRLAVDGAFSEGPRTSPLSFFGETPRTLAAVVTAIDRAKDDERVAGLYLEFSGALLPLAQAQELRSALLRFRDSGKPSVAFSESYDDQGVGTGYFLASAAQEVWLQPSGEIGLTGVAVETPYIRGLLAEIGVLPQFEQRKAYKSFPDMFQRSESSAANSEAVDSLARSIVSQLAEGIGGSRNAPPSAIWDAIDRAPLLAAEAKSAGLIDYIGYADEAEARMRQLTGPGTTAVSVFDYARSVAEELQEDGDATVAVIYANGPIHRGDSDVSPFEGMRSIGSATLTDALRDVADDDDVDAVILRIDSPGGSYVASDTLWREIRQLREGIRGNRGKPVIVSMGSVAASGGYFIAMAADRIVAQPGTLTGSIGVFSGKFSAAELWDRIGVNWDTTKVGTYADMMSPNRPFTDQERARLSRWLDTVYDDFTEKASQSRGMSPDAVEAAAQGRVWSGAQALDAGLVDRLGGLDTAVEVSRSLLNLSETARIGVKEWVPSDDPFDALLKAFSDDFGDIRGALDAMATLGRLSAAVTEELHLGTRQDQVLRSPQRPSW